MFKATVVAIFGTFLFQTVSFAQIYVKSNGVGVGTSTPAAKLHVSGKTLIESNDGDMLTFKSSSATAWQFLSFYKPGNRNLWMGLDEGVDFHIVNEKAGNIKLRSNGGRVYIESSYDNNNIGGTLMLRHPGKINAGQNMDWAIYNMKDAYGNGLSFWGYGSSTWGRVLTLGDNGNVSIGNIIPDNTYKLQVAGVVKAAEYKAYVSTTVTWPDYVFDTTIYKLPSLPEVETYLKHNRHLPEVPSAETVKKEGLNLGENQAVLLKKIEELTLYAIEQNKKQQEQNEKIELLEKKLLELMDKNK